VKFEPRPYQRLMIDFLKQHRRCNLHAGMGTGKTVSVLTAIVEQGLDLTDVILIIGPLRVARDVWPAEVAKWDHLSHLEIVPIIGNGVTRTRALRQAAPIYTINYDNLQWLVEHCGHDWPFTVVVADESTRLKGFRTRQGSKRARALAPYAHTKVKRWINLTGTPAPNGLLDLWGQQWFVDGGRALGRSYSAFANRWFHKAPWGGLYAPLIPNESAQTEIEAQIKPSTLAIRASDWFDLREPIVAEVWVDLPPAARKAYRTMERHFFSELKGGVVMAANAAVKAGKLLQLANGASYHEDKSWSWVHDAKIEALHSIVEETNGANLLVAYEFRSDLERIRRAFPQARALEQRDRTVVADWNAGKVAMLLAHPASAGHGLNLQQGGHHLVYFGQGWNLELFEQILERVGPTRQMQAGFDRPVYVYHILARGTMDEVARERRSGKLTVMDALLLAMKKS
jgi:SNF2 family DNA or RNA helicase